MRRFLVLALAVAAVAAGVLTASRRARFGRPGGSSPPPAGVREPRSPLQPAGAGSAAVDPNDS